MLIAQYSELSVTILPENGAVVQLHFVINENKDRDVLELLRVILPGDDDQDKFAFLIQGLLKDKSIAFAPSSVVRSGPGPVINAVPVVLVTLAIAVGTAIATTAATWITTKLLDKYGTKFFKAEPATTDNVTKINIVVVCKGCAESPEKTAAYIKAQMDAATQGKDGFPTFPSGEKWDAKANSSSFLSDGIYISSTSGNVRNETLTASEIEPEAAETGDLFTGIAAVLTGLGALVNPIGTIADILIEIRKGETIDVDITPKDGTEPAKVTIRGVRAKRLRSALKTIAEYTKKKDIVATGKAGGLEWKETEEAKDFLDAHPSKAGETDL
jgi:hypothetical protein